MIDDAGCFVCIPYSLLLVSLVLSGRTSICSVDSSPFFACFMSIKDPYPDSPALLTPNILNILHIRRVNHVPNECKRRLQPAHLESSEDECNASNEESEDPVSPDGKRP